MRSPLMTLLLACLLLAGVAQGQEAVPESDTIEPAKDEAAKSEGQTSVSEEHTVVSGDTLWDLCGKYLKNPWYWPRVWSYNPEITNPHWIYPGNVVRFYPGGGGPGEIDIISRDMEVPVPDDIALDEELLPEDMVEMAGNIMKMKTLKAVKILRNAFVTKDELDEMGTVRASREEKEFLSEGDRIYLDFKDLSGVNVGDRFTLYRTVSKIDHPVTGEFIGYFTKVLGACEIVSIAETSAVAVISTSTDPIIRGDMVGPMMDKLTKDVGPMPNEVEVRGYIVGSSIEHLTNFGENHLVFIDQGSEQGVHEGNVFDVVRREDGLFMPGEGKQEGKWDKSMPAEIYARIMVVDARPTASTGLVMESIRELRIGDRVLMSIK